jgi:hypothetical protein
MGVQWEAFAEGSRGAAEEAVASVLLPDPMAVDWEEETVVWAAEEQEEERRVALRMQTLA